MSGLFSVPGIRGFSARLSLCLFQVKINTRQIETQDIIKGAREIISVNSTL